MRGDRRSRAVLAVLGAGVLVASAGGIAVGRSTPTLTAGAVIGVEGTEASGTFQVAERTVRQVRYADGGTLRYTFEVHHEGRLPVTVTGLAPDQPPSRLFTPVGLTGPDGATPVTLEGDGTTSLTLLLRMDGCETLSSRAGAFVTEVAVSTERAGVLDDEVLLRLPEELHTGSPREAACPAATARSRPPG